MPDWIEVVWRTVISFVILFALARIFIGKRQIRQLSFFEYVTGITIGSLAAYISLDLDSHWILGVVSIVVWSIILLLVELITLKSKRLRNLLEGKGTVLIEDGKIMVDNLKKERYSTDELLEVLRQKDVFKIADVEFAVMETSGEVSVLLKKENQPLTSKQLGVQQVNEPQPSTVVMDGEILLEELAKRGLSQDWLLTEIEKTGVSVENVFLGQVDAYGELYVSLYDDKLNVPEPSNRQLLSATLKKCAADLELFCLATQNPTAKEMYANQAELLNSMIKQLDPLLNN